MASFAFRPGMNCTPRGYEKFTCAASTGPTAQVGDSANAAVFVAEGFPVRYRDDGGVPTATEGVSLAVGEKLEYTGDLRALKFIQNGGAATIFALYYDVRNPN